MMSVDQIVNTVKDFFTLKVTFDKSYDATSTLLSGSELGKACDAYRDNPNAVTAEAVRQANRDWYDKLFDWAKQPLEGNDAVKDSLTAGKDVFFNSEDDKAREFDLFNEREARLNREKFSSPEINADCKASWDNAKTHRPPRDPIILDLDGNGIKTVGLASNVHFDYDNDGVLTQTGWVGNGDALLVLDRNANGNIDNGSELFGDYTPITRTNADGTTTTTFAPNGFAALASLDSNGDGIIDANDPSFAQLKLWCDTNQDGTVNQSSTGITNTGELITLSEAGIVSLNLANVLKNQATGNGNLVTREGSFTKQTTTVDTVTGQPITQTVTQTMGEYNLAINTFDTQFKDTITVSDSAKILPNMRACTGMFLSSGSGNIRELQQAANDANWKVVA